MKPKLKLQGNDDYIKKQILLGSILGDGCIYYRKRKNCPEINFIETHSLKQKKYLLWKNRSKIKNQIDLRKYTY